MMSTLNALIGRKIGMTQMFDVKGLHIPVTVLQMGPCFVTQIKTKDIDGYSAVQLGFEDMRKNLVNKPETGTFKKAGVTPKRFLREVRTDGTTEFQLGQEIKCDIFNEGELVDVTAKTKGHGFTGVIKRWNQARVGPMSHGTGPVHRHVGSMGADSEPSRVFKNKKMAGQYGNEQVTVQNLTIVKVDLDKNVILVKGGVPGADGALVTIKRAVKGKKAGGGAK